MNICEFYGRITKKPEVGMTSTGKKSATFSIAINRNYKNADGVLEADFVRLKAYDKTADIIEKYFDKGSRIAVVCSFRNNSYENEKGERVYADYFIVNNVYFIDTKSDQNKPNSDELSQNSTNTSTTTENVENNALSDDLFASFGEQLELPEGVDPDLGF